MSVSRFNCEGYYDPVVYEALTNMEKEQRAAFKAVAGYRPLAYICSPYAGDIENNTAKAKKYSRFAVENSAIPFAPHLLMPQYMDESKERELALKMGIIFLSKCEEVWVFGERISSGMAYEIKRATGMCKKIRYFTEDLKKTRVPKS